MYIMLFVFSYQSY